MSKQEVTTLLVGHSVAFSESPHSSGEVSITIGRDGFLESLKPNRLTYLQFNSNEKLVRVSGQVIYGIGEGPGYDVKLK
ncbi:MAG: hypothetical protein KF836_11600 [Fimbriimonadaceae bacterium]|nr:hypothetical protein [Fimbriimonadaceae bacterium]